MLGLADDLAIAGFEDEVVLAVGGFFFLEFCFIGSVIGDRSDAIFRSLSIGVALGLEDDFAIAGFESEVEFLGFVALEEFVHCYFEYSQQGELNFARLSGESWPKFVEEDGRGGGDVEGVDLAGHGKIGEMVAEGFDFGAEAEVFGAEEEDGVFEGGKFLEGEGVSGETGSDEGAGLAECAEVCEEIG